MGNSSRRYRYDLPFLLTTLDFDMLVSDTVHASVLIGGAPFGFMNYPEKLYEQYGVRGVINMCEEYRGPHRKYKELGIEELHLPTTDHFEPSLEDLMVSHAFGNVRS